jgi:hypothetical protein
VQVGDLVKYDKSLSGLENCTGLIIGLDGLAFVVQWFDRHSKFVPGSETSVELPEFLEVISESR